tara:strand:+ start:352 stop:585 length:234 start_codon:yes stop_codon:yes gene_type:complete
MNAILDRATDEQIEKKYKLWHYMMVEGFGGVLKEDQIADRGILESNNVNIDSLRNFSGGFYKLELYWIERLNKKEQE